MLLVILVPLRVRFVLGISGCSTTASARFVFLLRATEYLVVSILVRLNNFTATGNGDFCVWIDVDAGRLEHLLIVVRELVVWVVHHPVDDFICAALGFFARLILLR